MSISTPDLFDAHRDVVSVADQGFGQYGGKRQWLRFGDY